MNDRERELLRYVADEIDAVGTARGSSLDNGEMSRITIALNSVYTSDMV